MVSWAGKDDKRLIWCPIYITIGNQAVRTSKKLESFANKFYQVKCDFAGIYLHSYVKPQFAVNFGIMNHIIGHALEWCVKIKHETKEFMIVCFTEKFGNLLSMWVIKGHNKYPKTYRDCLVLQTWT